MKMVKSLLLGTAAGLVALTGAQAADLPVKAKPAQYVKICSLYGAGYYYIPGTDTCIKIGGWVRAEYAFHSGNSDLPYIVLGGGRENRIDSNDLGMRARFVLSADVRTQTAYGTLRSYIRAGFQKTTGEGHARVYTERGFIQLGGFTFGQTQSFYDGFMGMGAYGNAYAAAGSQSGANGTNVFAYTASLGNGISLTLAAEDQYNRRGGIWDTTNDATNALVIGGLPGPASFSDSYNIAAVTIGDHAAVQFPDIVANLRVDQAWGSAQIMGALHQNRAGYYGLNTVATAAITVLNTAASPSDAWGGAIGAGVKINLPGLAPGSALFIEGTYSQGASAYAANAAVMGANSAYARFNSTQVAAAWAIDSIFGTQGTAATTFGQELTTAWIIGGGIEHYWTPAVRTSLYGNYTKFDFNANATAMFCGSPQSPVRTLAGAAPASFAAPLAGCNPDFVIWNVGTRTIWNPVANLDVGLEIMYSKIDQNMDANLVALNYAGAGGRGGAQLYAPADMGTWSSILRLQRNFWP